MNDTQMRTWVQISLENLEHNYKRMSMELPEGCGLMGIVKANAYGHGAAEVSRWLSSLGCGYFAVACLSEAEALRSSGINEPVLILGYTPPEYTKRLCDLDITQTVTDLDSAGKMSDGAVTAGKRLKVHIKVDTGMGRLGFKAYDAVALEEARAVVGLPGLEVQGIFTHFAVSDITEETYTVKQFEMFLDFTDRLEKKCGFRFEIKHCANSGAVVNYPQTALDMVRPGIALYGTYSKDSSSLGLRPVMELKTRIVAISELEPGSSVGYGRTYIAPERRRIATLPIGYADGLHRALSNRMQVLISGKRASQVGRVCMDMCMVDVTYIPSCAPGDIATIFGSDGDEFISVCDLAEAAGTISYEMLCSISARVPRIFLQSR